MCANINVYIFSITESQSGMQPKLNALPTAQKMKWKILAGGGAGKAENKKEINEPKRKSFAKRLPMCEEWWVVGSRAGGPG